jgi:hypothetical protein
MYWINQIVSSGLFLIFRMFPLEGRLNVLLSSEFQGGIKGFARRIKPIICIQIPISRQMYRILFSIHE